MLRASEIWSHPRCAGPINGLGDVAAMAGESASALARRTASYPGLIAADKLTQAAADVDIWAWAAIADDWAFIASNDGTHGQPANGGTLRARIAALDTGIARFFAANDNAAQKARRTVPQVISSAQQQQITSLLAMRYWAEFEAEIRIDANGAVLTCHPRDIAWINYQMRDGHSAESERKAA